MIRQFDVFRNPLRPGREQRPFVLVVQHALFDDLPTRVVVPLVFRNAITIQPRLNAQFRIGDADVHISPTEPFALAIRFLRAPLANLREERDRIIAALDLVFTGV